MRLELDLLQATDKALLPALLYTPEKSCKKVMIWLHGMGDSGTFYSPKRINALGKALTDKGIAFLAFNNRGAHNNKSLKLADDGTPAEEDGRLQAGTHYELITDCVSDIEGALDWLRRRGFSEFYLGGHSTGANKVCAYHVRARHNPFRKYILAGPGDDTGLFFEELGEKRFWQSLHYAAKHLKSQPLRLMPKYSGMHPFSVQSAWDILNPEGAYNTFPFYECTQQRLGKKPLFEEYHKIDLPTLVIFGQEDEYAFTAGDAAKALDLFIKHTSNSMLKKNDFSLVTGADHGFTGAEDIFAQQVADWLSRG